MGTKSVRHSLTINHTTFLRLKKKGFFGESFSELISRIIDELDNNNSKQEGTSKKIEDGREEYN
jgi:flagellar hook-basal body complex protein FliE